MSKVIDQRVVEMEFDNRQFERNVSTTMSTLEKLKRSLNLTGASKGLENVNAAAKNVNMSGLGSAVETVRMRFSALEVMGVTALANITNSAVNAGKRIVSALTIDPVKTGLQEYETKMNAIQVIQANTRGKNTMDEITAALDELNEYADKTIYNFAQMTSNVGKFVAQGLDAKQAANAVKGLANLAAASGASAEDMARATYQMSQALSGTIKMIDWNSLRNANMATVDLKNTLMDLARVNGIAIDDMIKKHGSFEQTLSEGWLSGEMFTEAMNIYSGIYSEAELKAKGFTDSQIANFMELAKMAESAATEVKTFTQLWDVLKETAQSGWTQTWEIIFGDFETAKKMFTELQVYFSDFLNVLAESRNTLLGGAFNLKNPWTKITEKLGAAGLGKIKKVAETIGDVTDKLEYFQDVVNKVWRGDYKRSDTGRFELLKEAGYDYRVVQDLVNKGYNYKLTIEDIEESHKKFGLTLETTSDSAKNTTESFAELSDEQLRNAGLTESEIRLYRALSDEAKRSGRSISEVVDEMSKNDGRTMLIDSIKNAWSGLVTILKSVRDAWVDVFPPVTVVQIYNIIKAINQFSEKLVVSDETADKLTRTFKGLFAIVDILATIFGGAFRIAFKFVTELLSYFHLDILDVTAAVGDALVRFRDWVDSILNIRGAVEKVAPYVEKFVKFVSDLFSKIKDSELLQRFASYLKKVADAVRDLFGSIKDSKWFNSFVSGLSKASESIRKWFDSLKNSKNLPADIISGLVNGLKNGVGAVVNAAVELAVGLWEGFCKFMGIHSPSTKMMEAGENIVDGLGEGISNSIPSIRDVISKIGSWIVDTFKNLDFSKISASLWTVSAFLPSAPIFNILAAIANFASVLGETFINKVKEVLGINSPSTVMEGIGGNIIQGLVNGLKNGIKTVGTWVSNIAKTIANGFKNIDWGVVIATGFGVGMLITANRIISVFDKIVSPLKSLSKIFETVNDVVRDIGTSVSKYFKAKKLSVMSKAILDMAIAIGILAASVWVLSKVDEDDLWRSVGAVAALAGVIAALAGVSVLLNKFGNFGGESISVLAIAGALLILSFALKQLAGINADDIPKVLKMMAAMVGGLAVILVVFGKFSNPKTSKDLAKAGIMLLKMSLALMIMVKVIKLASKLNGGEIGKGLAVVGAVGMLFAALIAVSKLAGKNANKAGTMLLLMSFAFLSMIGVIKLASKLKEREITKGIAVITMVGLMFSVLIAVSRLAGKNAVKAGVMILSMSAAILLIVFFMKQLADLSDKDVKRGLGVIAGISAIFAAIIALSKFAGSNAAKAGTMLLMMSGSLLILTGVMFLLSKFDPDGLKRSLAAVSVLMVLMGGLIAVTKLAADVNKGTLITLVVAIGLLSIALIGLYMLDDQEKLRNATLALSTIIVAFGLLITVTKFANSTKGMTKMLIQMLIVVSILALIVAGLSLIDPTSVIPNVTALSILLLAFSGAMVIISKAGKMSAGSIASLLLMDLVVAGLAAILWGMSELDVDSALPNAIALSVLLLAMSGALAILSLTGPNALAGVGAMALMGLVVAELAVILGVMSHFDIEPSIETATSLSILLLAMSAACAIVSLIPAPAAIQGALGLAGFVAVIGTVIAALGGLMKIDGFEEIMKDGGKALGLIGEAIGNFVGGIVKGAVVTVASSLPEIGTYLSEFMTNVTPFIEGVKSLDISVLSGTGILAGAILALTAVDLLAGISQILSFGYGFAQLGSDLSAFMSNAEGFIQGASALDESLLAGVKTLAETILILTAANVLEGLTAWFTGGASLATFGEQLPALGTNLSQFVTNLGTFGEDQIATITCAANAIKALATAADTLPNEGGWVAKIVGENSIATFSSYLPGLGTNLKQFASNLGTFGEDQIATVKCAANAIKAMAEAADKIPNEGGWVAKIVGENSIATFGAKLPALGTNLKGFATNLGTFGEDQIATVKCAANAIKAMAEAADKIPNEGGWVAKIVGENSIATFGSKLPGLGTNLKDFAANLGTFGDDQIATVKCAATAVKEMALAAESIDGQAEWAKTIFGDNGIASFSDQFPTLGTNLASFAKNLGTFNSEKVETVKQSVNAIKAFTDLADANLKGAKNNLEGFSDKLPGFASDVASFCTNMPDSFTLASAVSNLRRVMKVVEDIGAMNTNAADDFVDALKKLGGKGVDSFVKAFTSETAKTDVMDAAKKLAAKAVEGVEAKQKDFKNAADDLADAGASEIKTQDNYNAWKNAGKYLVQGFAAGISENSFMAEAKASAMASAALKKAKAALDINSPSKEFRKVGSAVPEGFAQGIDMFGYMVTDSIAGMANSTIDRVGNAISRISYALNADMDTQPTIQPVMDLSNVRTGIGAINDMFSMSPSVGVMSSIRSISSSMNSNRQNGTNDDVISAIDRLGRSMANTRGGDTYNVNGITYDDGSNITDAVKTLVRAAKIERRV